MINGAWLEHLDFTRKSNEISYFLERVGKTNDKFLRNNIYIFDLEDIENILDEDDKPLCEDVELAKLIYYNLGVSLYGLYKGEKVENYILINDWNDEESHFEKRLDYDGLLDCIEYKVLDEKEASHIINAILSYETYLRQIIDTQHFDNWEIGYDKKCHKDGCFKCKNLNKCCAELEEKVDAEIATNDYWEEYYKFNPHER